MGLTDGSLSRLCTQMHSLDFSLTSGVCNYVWQWARHCCRDGCHQVKLTVGKINRYLFLFHFFITFDIIHSLNHFEEKQCFRLGSVQLCMCLNGGRVGAAGNAWESLPYNVLLHCLCSMSSSTGLLTMQISWNKHSDQTHLHCVLLDILP